MRRKPLPKVRHDPVPSFVFYGEECQDDDFGGFHLELLSHRSALHNWEIRPHKHEGLVQIFVLSEGEVTASIDGRAVHAVAPVVLTLPSRATHSFKYAPGSEGYVLTLAGPPSAGLDPAVGRMLMDALFDRPHRIELAADDLVRTQLLGLLAQLRDELGRSAPESSLMTSLLMNTLLVMLVRAHRRSYRHDSPVSDRMVQFHAFEALVDAGIVEHRSPASYASALNMSESTLNRLCRSCAGRTAFQVIQDRLLREAKRRLVYSTAQIADIATDLGFSDQAYFSRFVRRLTGLSPLTLRRETRAAMVSTGATPNPALDMPTRFRR